jgi:phosphopantetheinyl transferase (holo-ACP synthase)
MNAHLLLEAIIAATSVMSLSSSLAGLWVAKKAAGKAMGEVKDVIEDPVEKTRDTVGTTAGRVKKVAARQG